MDTLLSLLLAGNYFKLTLALDTAHKNPQLGGEGPYTKMAFDNSFQSCSTSALKPENANISDNKVASSSGSLGRHTEDLTTTSKISATRQPCRGELP